MDADGMTGWPEWVRERARLLSEAMRAAQPPPPPPEPRLPSLGRMIGNIATTGAALLKDGGHLASRRLRAARWRVCRRCENFRRSDRRCGGMTGCGCYLKAKITLKASACPLDRWPPPDDAS